MKLYGRAGKMKLHRAKSGPERNVLQHRACCLDCCLEVATNLGAKSKVCLIRTCDTLSLAAEALRIVMQFQIGSYHHLHMHNLCRTHNAAEHTMQLPHHEATLREYNMGATHKRTRHAHAMLVLHAQPHLMMRDMLPVPSRSCADGQSWPHQSCVAIVSGCTGAS